MMQSLGGKLALMLGLVLSLVCADTRANPGASLGIYPVKVLNVPADKVILLGSQIEVSFKVENGGDGTANSYIIHLAIWQNRTTQAHKHSLGVISRGSLSPGETDYFTSVVTLPDECPRGWYYVYARIECAEDPYSMDRVWNGTEFKLLAPRPDLKVVEASVNNDSVYPPGGDVPVSVSVQNIGGMPCDNYSVEYYAGDACVGTSQRGGLQRGGAETFVTTCRLPDDIAEGSYSMRVKAVCENDDNPSDNEFNVSKTISVQLFSDLGFQWVEVDARTCAPDGQITIHSLVVNTGDRDSDAYTVRYYVSADADITIRDQCIGSRNFDGLAKGAQRGDEISCRLPPYIPRGVCYVGAIVTCANDGYPRNNAGVVSAPLTVEHPPGYICGRITCKDLDGWTHPVRYVVIRVYAADDNSNPLDDRMIREAYADADGNYGVLLQKDAGEGGRIYIKAFPQASANALQGTSSTICSVRDDVLREIYSLKSPLYSYPKDTSLVANMQPSQAGGEFLVYESIVESFLKARAFFGIDPNEIAVYWPSSDNGTYYDPDSGIHIAKEDRGDRDVIMHEYGHYVADLGGFAQGDVGDFPMHYWRIDLRYSPSNRIAEHARNLAFREAWATLFSIATQYGDFTYPYAGDAKYQDYDETLRKRFAVDLESETMYHSQPGEFYENMNACALWDIFDDNCDAWDNRDTLSDSSLSMIWTVLRQSRPENMKGFWDGWFTKYAYAREMLRIFKDHGMGFPYTGPSAAVEGFETGDLKAFAWMCPEGEPWRITSDVRCKGTYSAVTAAIGNGQKSVLEITLTVDGGPLRFWRKVSTEDGFDRLRFSMDGQMVCEWSGEKDWQQAEFSVNAGIHTFTWAYLKSPRDTDGADAAWLDDIEFPIW